MNGNIAYVGLSCTVILDPDRWVVTVLQKDRHMDISHISAILYEEWDPIGVNEFAPRDECESYAERIAEMLDHGGYREDVLAFLNRSRNGGMMPNSDRQRDIAVIDLIEDCRRSLVTLAF